MQARPSPNTTRSSRWRRRGGGFVIALLVVLCIALIGGAGILYALLPGTSSAGLPPSPGLDPLDRVALGLILSQGADSLDQPAGTSSDTVLFVVQPGLGASQITRDLSAVGLISDPELFLAYLRYYGLDTEIDAGTYALRADMSMTQIAAMLATGETAQVLVQVIEGWRREQIAALVDGLPLAFSGEDFLRVTGPATVLRPSLSIAPPEGLALEGYLFPATYTLELDTTAEDFAAQMVTNLASRIDGEMSTAIAARGLSLHEALTLASIVEREARLPEERPLIASVYLNRLAIDMKLEADPTVQYALGYQADTGDWWKLGLTIDDLRSVDSPYNTYMYPGVPPGPIASPGIDSLRAVAFAAESPYYFFRAKCDGSGGHNFAVTFEEHLANACP